MSNNNNNNIAYLNQNPTPPPKQVNGVYVIARSYQ